MGIGNLISPFELELLAELDPDLADDVAEVAESETRDAQKERCEASLIEFFVRAWREIESPYRPLSLNWHHEVICEHLQAVARGEIRNLIINVPPRHTKSLLCSVAFPAWLWALPPNYDFPLMGAHVKFLCVSYSAELSESIALKMQRLVHSEWYQDLWGDRVQLMPDQRGRADFANRATGERSSKSIETGLIGRGGDIQIVDDPQTRRGADSEAERAESLRGMSDLTTRITDPRINAQILIQQRLHVNDATDWALRNWPSDTVHLMFPARFEPDRCVPEDIRTEPGELLWPELWPEEELRKIELGLAALDGEVLSDYASAGQLQQNPVPRRGGVISEEDWKVYPEVVPKPGDVRRDQLGRPMVWLPEVSFVLVALDTAYSEKETADWNACLVWGVWDRRREEIEQPAPWFTSRWRRGDAREEAERILQEDGQPRVILMEAWRRRCRLNDPKVGPDGKPLGLVQRVIETAQRRKASLILIEDKTRGKDVKDEIQRNISGQEFRIELFDPRRHGDKLARLHSVQPLFAQGLVYAPGNLVERRAPSGQEYISVEEFAWTRMVMDEVKAVPRGQHDDCADATSMPLLWLRQNGFLSLTQEYVRDQLRSRVWTQKRQTVAELYGV